MLVDEEGETLMLQGDIPLITYNRYSIERCPSFHLIFQLIPLYKGRMVGICTLMTMEHLPYELKLALGRAYKHRPIHDNGRLLVQNLGKPSLKNPKTRNRVCFEANIPAP